MNSKANRIRSYLLYAVILCSAICALMIMIGGAVGAGLVRTSLLGALLIAVPSIFVSRNNGFIKSRSFGEYLIVCFVFGIPIWLVRNYASVADPYVQVHHIYHLGLGLLIYALCAVVTYLLVRMFFGDFLNSTVG